MAKYCTLCAKDLDGNHDCETSTSIPFLIWLYECVPTEDVFEAAELLPLLDSSECPVPANMLSRLANQDWNHTVYLLSILYEYNKIVATDRGIISSGNLSKLYEAYGLVYDKNFPSLTRDILDWYAEK